MGWDGKEGKREGGKEGKREGGRVKDVNDNLI